MHSLRVSTKVAPRTRRSFASWGTEQTIYRGKKKFAGLDVAKLRRLRQLKEENKKTKATAAD